MPIIVSFDVKKMSEEKRISSLLLDHIDALSEKDDFFPQGIYFANEGGALEWSLDTSDDDLDLLETAKAIYDSLKRGQCDVLCALAVTRRADYFRVTWRQ